MKAGKWGMAIAALVSLAMAATVNASSDTIRNGTTYGPISRSLELDYVCRIQVPGNISKLVIETWGGTGNADVYVRHEAMPWLSVYIARGVRVGNSEVVTVGVPNPGWWYIKLHAKASFSGVMIRARYTENMMTTISSGTTFRYSGTRTSQRHFRLWVPAGQSKLEVTTWGGTGNCWLYARYYAPPQTFAYYDARSVGLSTDNSIIVHNPKVGYYYFMIYGHGEHYGNVNFRATYGVSEPTVPSVNNNSTTGPRSGALGNKVYYRIWVPAGCRSLNLSSWGGTGDADVYLKKGALPTTTSYAARGYSNVNTENVTINNPASGWWYIMIHGYKAYSGLYWKPLFRQ